MRIDSKDLKLFLTADIQKTVEVRSHFVMLPSSDNKKYKKLSSETNRLKKKKKKRHY